MHIDLTIDKLNANIINMEQTKTAQVKVSFGVPKAPEKVWRRSE